MPIQLPHIVLRNHMHENVSLTKAGFISPEDYQKLRDALDSSLLGAPNGIATLGPDGLLTESQRAGGGDGTIPTTASQIGLADYSDYYDSTNVEDALSEIYNKFAMNGHIHDWSEIYNKPATYAPSAHTHAISEVTGLYDWLDGNYATKYHQHEISDVYGLTEMFAFKSNIGHTHVIQDISNLSQELNEKADYYHTHAVSDITNLEFALFGKADYDHTHYIRDIDGLQTQLDGKASVSHTHAISDVTNLQTKLDEKSDTTHSHSYVDITGLSYQLGLKSGINHKHVISDITNLQDTLNTKATTSDVASMGNATLASSKSYTESRVADLINTAPAALDTLKELATALGNDPNFATTMTNQLASKANATDLSSHTGNTTVHITAAERTTWNAKANASHTHAISEVTGLQAALDAKASTAVATTTASGLMSTSDKIKLDGIAAGATNYVHPSGDGNLHVPATGTTSNAKVLRAGATAGALSWGIVDFSEIGNRPATYAPSAHVHAIADVTNLQATLDGKAAATHTHVIGDVTNLQTTLDGKSAIGHTHVIGDVTNLQTTLNGKAALSHTHAIGDVTNLQTTLDGKAASLHSHVIGDVTNLQTTLDGKASATHTHAIADVTNLQASLDAKASTAIVTTTTDGLMIASDKVKLNGIATNANNYVHPSGDGNLHVPATSTTNNGKLLKAGATAGALSWSTIAYSELTGVPTTFAPSAHTHAIADVTNLQATLDGKASTAQVTTTTDGLMIASDKVKLNGIAANANNYVHPTTDGSLHVPATGTTNNLKVLKAGATAGTFSWSSVAYSELTGVPTTFAPSAHTHAISDVTNLQSTLDGKAASVHTHAIADVSNLQSSLDAKAAVVHSHAIADVTNLQTTLNGKVSESLRNVANGFAGLDATGKIDPQQLPAAGTTTVDWANVQNKPTTFTPSAHTHAIADVTDLQTTLDGKASTAIVTTTANGLMIAADKVKLNGIATGANNYVHPSGDGNLHVPVTSTTNNLKVLKAGATAGAIAWGNVAYSELTGVPTSFAPSAHTHAIADVTNLQSSLDAKAAVSHTHAIADVTNLQTTLDGKASTAQVTTTTDGLMIASDKVKLNGIATNANNYVHPTGDGNLHVPVTSTTNNLKVLKAGSTAGAIAWGNVAYSELTGVPASFTPSAHTHTIAQVTNLQTTLDGKAAATHTHAIADVSGLQLALDDKPSIATAQGYAATAETNAKSYTDTKVSQLVDAAPGTLDTLNELAQALGDNPNFATTISNQIAAKADGSALTAHTGDTVIHVTQTDRDTWNAKANGTHTHAISDVTNLQTTLNGKASTAQVTTTTDGLMIAADKVKLNGIATSANNYVHPSGDGNLHVPVTSTTNNGKVLKAGATAGAISWSTVAYGELTGVPSTFAPSAHTHAISDVTNLQSTLDGKASATHTHAISDVTNLQTTLDGKASTAVVTTTTDGLMIAADKVKLNGIATSANNYVHPSGDGSLHVPATSTTNNGKVLKAGATAGAISWSTIAYSELTGVPTTFAPSAHTHAISEVTNLQTTLDGKSDVGHVHAISDVTNLQTTLNGKASTAQVTTTTDGLMIAADKVKLNGIATSANNYVHPTSDGSLHVPATSTTNNGKVLKAGATAGNFAWSTIAYSELTGVPSTFAPSAHTHAIADVTGLQSALDGKASSTHSHAIGDVTNLQTTLDGKAAATHTHAIADVTNLQTTLDGKAASAHTHAIADVTNLQTTLNGKASTSVATTTVNGLMSAADKSKLDGIPAGGSSYTHPTGDGNLHVPATGTTSAGMFLEAGSTAGSLSWNFITWADVTSKPTTFAPSAHTHAISEVTNLQTTLDGKASTAVVTTTTNGLMIAADKVKLNGIATSANNYVHPTGDGNSHVPATGTTNNLKVLKAGATAASAAWGNVAYSELTGVPSSFTPSAHTHAIADVTGLQFALNDKANATHSHAIGDVTDLQLTLDGKAASSHTHVISDVSLLQSTLDGKAPTSHTHTIANVTNLQSSLDGKANTTHTHSIDQVDLLWNVLNEKVPKTGGFLDSPTIMGKMTFDSNVYLSAGGVLDLNNSDIIGMNGIYFNDVSDANEGIGFLKSGETAKSLSASSYDIFKIIDGEGFIGSTPIFTAKANSSKLWSGVLMMQSGESVVPSKKLSQCPGGWVLVWSDLNPPSTSQDAQWVYSIVPKYAATTPGSQYFIIPTNHTGSAVSYTIKTLTISDTTIGGGTNNSSSTVLSDDVCLRAVVEF